MFAWLDRVDHLFGAVLPGEHLTAKEGAVGDVSWKASTLWVPPKGWPVRDHSVTNFHRHPLCVSTASRGFPLPFTAPAQLLQAVTSDLGAPMTWAPNSTPGMCSLPFAA